jgi:hypothetical protein
VDPDPVGQLPTDPLYSDQEHWLILIVSEMETIKLHSKSLPEISSHLMIIMVQESGHLLHGEIVCQQRAPAQ